MSTDERPVLDRKLGYQPALDGIRAVAVLLVVGFHSIEFPLGGFLGVDIFFVLSGFLITTLLMQEWEETGAISLRKFYARRVLRLFPALFVLVIAYLLLTLIFQEMRPLKLSSAIYSLLYVSNWIVAFELPFHRDALVHLWSVAVEEQFYLIWPSMMLVVVARRSSTMVRALLGLIGLVIVWRLWLTLNGAGFERTYFALDTRFDELLIGCLGGVLFVRYKDKLASIAPSTYIAASIAAFIGLAIAILIIPHPNSRFLELGGYPLVSLGVLIVILTCVTRSWKWLVSILALPVLVYIGKISYSLYLWHVVINYFTHDFVPFGSFKLARIIQVLVSFAAAIGSYHLVEGPFLKLKERFASRRVTRPARGPGRLPYEMEPEK